MATVAQVLVTLVSRLLWVATAAGAVFGGLNFWLTRMSASEASAPQIAALAAESLAFAIMPYVLARAWDHIFRPWSTAP